MPFSFAALVIALATGFLPHGARYVWHRPLLLTHLVLDLAIAAASIVISLAVACVVYRVARVSAAHRMQLATVTQSNHVKSRFMATMSHELRTPLNAIVGYSELLALGMCGPVTTDQRQKLVRVQENARHLTELISEVLDFERLDAGLAQVLSEPTGRAGVEYRAAISADPGWGDCGGECSWAGEYVHGSIASRDVCVSAG